VPESIHLDGCHPGDACVECGGCGCGAIPSACEGPGCQSVDEHGQWWDENGHDHEGCSYGCH
jgi:hypothetical protein